MDDALKRIVAPALRKLGFTGSFPHFRRLTQIVDLVTFQFDRNGGGFVIEVAKGDVLGSLTHWGKHIEASKLTAWDLHPDRRKRLAPDMGSGTDSWFRYEDSVECDDVARDALSHLQTEYQQAEKRGIDFTTF